MLSSDMKVSPWMREPEPDPYCWMRIILGGDPNDQADRVAFCEKSARVRRASFTTFSEESGKWDYGYKGGYDSVSNLKWCDSELEKMGYVLLDRTIPPECG